MGKSEKTQFNKIKTKQKKRKCDLSRQNKKIIKIWNVCMRLGRANKKKWVSSIIQRYDKCLLFDDDDYDYDEAHQAEEEKKRRKRK